MKRYIFHKIENLLTIFFVSIVFFNVGMTSGFSQTNDSVESEEAIKTNISSAPTKKTNVLSAPTKKTNVLSVSTKINRVIVTASRKEETKESIPYSTSIVDEEEIEENVFTALVDLLDKTPGFSQIYEYHSPLLLRGVAGSRIIILKNGLRQMGSMPNGFMGQTVNIFDIKRVEIIRGPGSVMYGSGAMGGIINIISSDIFEQEGFEAKLAGAYGFNSMERVILGRIGWSDKKFAFQASGRYRKATNYIYAGGETALNTFHQDKDVSTRLGYKFNKNTTLLLDADLHFGGPWGKPESFNRKPMWVHNENDNTYHFGTRFLTKAFGIFDEFSISGFYDYQTRTYHKEMFTTMRIVSEETVVDYLVKYGGGSIVGNINRGIQALSIGADGYIFNMWSPQTIYNYIYDSTNKSLGDQGSGIGSIGVFAQDNLKISSNFNVILGVRYDYAEVNAGDNPSAYTALLGTTNTLVNQNAISGNIGIVYHLAKKSSVSLNFARAFRMPSQSEMFSEKITCAGVVLGDPALKPEYSWNIDAGLKGFHKGFEFDVALFANFFEDLIERHTVTDIPNVDMVYANVQKARIMGTELVFAYMMRDLFARGHSLKPGVSFVAYRGDNLTDKKSFDIGDPLHQIAPPRFKTFIRYIGFAGPTKFFFEFDMDYNFRNDRVPADELVLPWSNEASEAYAVFGLKLGIKLYEVLRLDEIKLNFSIKNLFDTQYNPYGSHILGKGRSAKLFMSIAI